MRRQISENQTAYLLSEHNERQARRLVETDTSYANSKASLNPTFVTPHRTVSEALSQFGETKLMEGLMQRQSEVERPLSHT